MPDLKRRTQQKQKKSLELMVTIYEAFGPRTNVPVDLPSGRRCVQRRVSQLTIDGISEFDRGFEKLFDRSGNSEETK